MKISGLISEWLLSCRSDSDTLFVLKVNNKITSPVLSSCTTEKRSTVFGEAFPYFAFNSVIDLTGEKETLWVSAVLAAGCESMEISLRYKASGKFLSDDSNYALNCSPESISIYPDKHNTY